MPPKNSQKEPDEPLTQILMDKLKENQEQRDARHAAITTVLQSITEKLADIRFVPVLPNEPPPDILAPNSISHLTQHGSSTPPIHNQPPSRPSHQPNYPSKPNRELLANSHTKQTNLIIWN
ncbi:hypothetical protein Lal_00011790 [Lupinus albus]|nr:hypothetical protein Lal_00011790 [Lupinus albus]